MNDSPLPLAHHPQAPVRQPGLWLCFRALPLLVGWLMLALLLNASIARSQTAETDSELAGAGYLLLEGPEGQSLSALTQASKVHFDISGMLAVVILEQRFSNQSPHWVEGVYGFPLPDQAAVRHMEIEIGERRIVGTIREKAEAKAVYQAAKKAGKKASLVEQQRPNMFSNRIANIGPGETITVRLEYVQPVEYVGGTFTLRFPTTITPRYMPGLPENPAGEAAVGAAIEEGGVLVANPYLGWARATSEVPDAAAISPLQHAQAGSDATPHNPVSITANLDIGMPLASVDAPYHQIALNRDRQAYSLALATGVAEMDRDFVLNWQPVSGQAPAAAVFTEVIDGEHYGLLMVLPPVASAAAARPLAREVVFVVDTSGSMGGVSIAQARNSVAAALRQLRPEDRFNIIEFNSNYQALYRSPMPASEYHLQQALEFVRHLEARGGTEMLPALRAALSVGGDNDQYREQVPLRQVVFITDGAVGNEAALFEEIAARLGTNRLFTVGIGSAPNSWFMRKAADFGRGVHTHIGDVGEVGEKMADLFAYMARPVAVNVEIDWPGEIEAWPERVPDLYQGHPLLVSVKFGEQLPTGQVQVRADIAGSKWQQQLEMPSIKAEDEASHPGVASLWARQKIAGLLDLKVLGESEESVRGRVLPLALEHKLLSPYTSFVAVEEQVSRPPGEHADSKAVANSRPRGQTAQPYAYPRTATSGPAQLWLGILLLFVALMIKVLRQPEVNHVPAT